MAYQLTSLKIRPGSLYHAVDRLTEEKLIRRAGTALAEIDTLGRDVAGSAVLVAAPRAELSWLHGVAGSMRSELRRQQTDEVGI